MTIAVDLGLKATKQTIKQSFVYFSRLSPFVFFYGTVFDLDLVVDATDYGNDARFIRRSCLPNAIVSICLISDFHLFGYCIKYQQKF